MPRVKKQSFDQLSAAERAVVGQADDYAWESARTLPPRSRRSESAQFSLRLDRSELEALAAIAAKRGITFSEAVREAIRRYVASGGSPALTNIQISVGSVGILRSEGRAAQLQPNRAEPDAGEVRLDTEPPRTLAGSR